MDFGLDFGMPKQHIFVITLGLFSILLPRSAQEPPKRSPRALEEASKSWRGSKMGPRGPLGTDFSTPGALRDLKNEPF